MKKILMTVLMVGTILEASGTDELYLLRLDLELAQSAILLNPQRVCKESIRTLEIDAKLINVSHSSVFAIDVAERAKQYASDLAVYCTSKQITPIHYEK